MTKKQIRYSAEIKEAMLQKMLPPQSISVPQLAQDTGISDVTLYKWRNNYQQQGGSVSRKKTSRKKWNPTEKFRVITETASFNESELSEYFRKKGLLKGQVAEWKQVALLGCQADNVEPQRSKCTSGV